MYIDISTRYFHIDQSCVCVSSETDNLDKSIGHDHDPIPVPVHVDDSENEDVDDDADDNNDIRGSDDDEQEDPKDYCKGGYHPITIGSIFNQRYHVIRKLGWGIFPTMSNTFDSVRIVFTRSFLNGLAMLGS
jgi:hypothetical protein